MVHTGTNVHCTRSRKTPIQDGHRTISDFGSSNNDCLASYSSKGKTVDSCLTSKSKSPCSSLRGISNSIRSNWELFRWFSTRCHQASPYTVPYSVRYPKLPKCTSKNITPVFPRRQASPYLVFCASPFQLHDPSNRPEQVQCHCFFHPSLCSQPTTRIGQNRRGKVAHLGFSRLHPFCFWFFVL